MRKNGSYFYKKLHSKKAGAVFLLFLVFFCILFTDIALKKKGQTYHDLWENVCQRFFECGARTLLEEILPVYDFLDYGSSDSSLFAELSEMMVPSQQFLARDCYERHGKKKISKKSKAKWKKKEEDKDTSSASEDMILVDYDEMVYKENKDSSETEETEAVSISEDTKIQELEDLELEDSGHSSEEYIAAESYFEDTLSNVITENEAAEQLLKNKQLIEKLKKSKSISFLLSNFYIIDGSTNADKKIFKVKEMLKKNMKIKKVKKSKKKKKPQIMIYHTHASEGFVDSRTGKSEDTVVGIGTLLTDILENTYGYQVYHDTTKYDIVNGTLDRNKAYNQAADGIEEALKKYPSIEVIIDLHRDSGNKRVTMINGKKTAQMMLFNGISRNKNGNIEYLYNPNLKGNLAFSLQMKLKAMSLFPDFAKPIYIKGYRYNLHYKEKSLLIELGTDKNTVEEARNAMEPLAMVLDQVLSGD